MQNLLGVVFIWTQTYREIFKPALMYLRVILQYQSIFRKSPTENTFDLNKTCPSTLFFTHENCKTISWLFWIPLSFVIKESRKKRQEKGVLSGQYIRSTQWTREYLPFLYTLKTSENVWSNDVFRGYRKGKYSCITSVNRDVLTG